MGGNLIPRQIITGLTIDYKNHCHLKLGYYTQVHESHDNTMQEQTTGYIALRPTGNSQGSYLLMSLTTGRILNRRGFTLLPLQQDVINGMHHLTHRNPRGLDIQDRDRHPFLEPEYGSNDDDNDSTYAPSDNDNSNNEDESGNNDSDNYNKSNLHPPSDQEMAQGPAGVTIHKNAGVHQNANMHYHRIAIMTLTMTPLSKRKIQLT